MSRKRPRILLILILLLLILAAALLTFEYFRRSAGENREPGRVEDEVAEIIRNMSLEEKIGHVKK